MSADTLGLTQSDVAFVLGNLKTGGYSEDMIPTVGYRSYFLYVDTG